MDSIEGYVLIVIQVLFWVLVVGCPIFIVCCFSTICIVAVALLMFQVVIQCRNSARVVDSTLNRRDMERYNRSDMYKTEEEGEGDENSSEKDENEEHGESDEDVKNQPLVDDVEDKTPSNAETDVVDYIRSEEAETIVEIDDDEIKNPWTGNETEAIIEDVGENDIVFLPPVNDDAQRRKAQRKRDRRNKIVCSDTDSSDGDNETGINTSHWN